MSGETNLAILLRSMNPILQANEYVFCSLDEKVNESNWLQLNPIGMFREKEGLTLILNRDQADNANILYTSIFKLITLSVHSSLDAVGFLATITSKLAEKGISVNPISAYYHDHLFVPASRVTEVMELLHILSR
jgi:hypothetical protein